MTPPIQPALKPTALEALAEELRAHNRFLLTTHEGPDGDALGSLLAMHELLGQLGKDSVMFLPAKEFPLPVEYQFLPLADVFHEPPADVADRVLVFLDCGNIDRMPEPFLRREGAHILNIDHHHDNTRFGTIDYVDPGASCTAEMVWDLMNELGVTPDLKTAEALYVGVVTDTGRFMYENTGPRAHHMAAALIEAGVDTHLVYRRLYEEMPFGKLALLGRALQNVARYDGGALTIAHISREDFAAAQAEDSYSEGIVDHLRSVEGTKVAALAREIEPHRWKVSLRSTDGEVDVSVIARAGGGGGHRQAAGFSTAMGGDELVAFLRDRIADQLAAAHS